MTRQRRLPGPGAGMAVDAREEKNERPRERGLPWFRVYGDALVDPKVQLLPDPLFKFWFNALCAASRNAGKLPSPRDLAFFNRLSEDETALRVEQLISLGLIDRDGDSLRPHNWDRRQFESDASTSRVQEHRARNAQAQRQAPAVSDLEGNAAEESPGDCHGDNRDNVTAIERFRNVSETPSESESDSESESSSSSVVPFAPRAKRENDDDEIILLRLKGIFKTKAEDRVLKAGISRVREWLAENCDLEADVFAELKVVASRLGRNPLRHFNGEFLGRQVRTRRDARLAAQRARAGPPPPRSPDLPPPKPFFAADSPEFAAWREYLTAHGQPPPHEFGTDPSGSHRKGWYFSTPWPPGHPASNAPSRRVETG